MKIELDCRMMCMLEKPLLKRSFGRPDTGVGYIFFNCLKDQVRMWVEY
jgi:hypothetical protein